MNLDEIEKKLQNQYDDLTDRARECRKTPISFAALHKTIVENLKAQIELNKIRGDREKKKKAAVARRIRQEREDDNWPPPPPPVQFLANPLSDWFSAPARPPDITELPATIGFSTTEGHISRVQWMCYHCFRSLSQNEICQCTSSSMSIEREA